MPWAGHILHAVLHDQVPTAAVDGQIPSRIFSCSCRESACEPAAESMQKDAQWGRDPGTSREWPRMPQGWP